MTQRHPRQGDAFALFDAAPPLREREPPKGFAWCGPCFGTGHVGDRICPACNGGRLSLLQSTTLEEVE